MIYYTYKITNLINGKIYIGVHKTEDLNDSYMGSGTVLKQAISKYGIENFRKDILMFHDTEDDMFEIEALIVDQDFIDRKGTYNVKLGGQGGWDYVNATMDHETRKRISSCGGNATKFSDKRHDAILKISKASKNMWNTPGHKEKVSKKLKETFSKTGGAFKGKTHSIETKLKMSRDDRSGKKNSQFGKMWIYSLGLKQSKRIDKNEPIPDGWNKGRKIF